MCNPSRYNFNLRIPRVWKQMFAWRPFWGMWGVRKTIRFMAHDTFYNVRCGSENLKAARYVIKGDKIYNKLGIKVGTVTNGVATFKKMPLLQRIYKALNINYQVWITYTKTVG